MSATKEQLFDRFAGAMLGQFIGDALGMPVEGRSPDEIVSAYGGLLDDLVSGRFPAGWYTDDTQMAIGLLESLVMARGFDPARAAQRFLANYDPGRGYGGRIHGIMHRLKKGESWDQVGTDSFGNGSAMRAAPVGFYFFDDLEKVKDAAILQAAVTHRHPEALAGAVIQAGACALAVRTGLAGERPVPLDFLNTLADLAKDLDEVSGRRLMDLAGLAPGSLAELIPQIRERYRCDIRAVEAVGPAVAAFLFTERFEDVVVLAVNLGGDTDTVGAMAGAMAGAYYGRSALPRKWLDRLENGTKGRDYVMKLCQAAADQRG